MHKTAFRAAVSGLTALTLFVANVPAAHAEEVSPDGKGIAGGALLGAELVTIVESLAGVRQGLWYGIGAGVGAIGGGVGGYFIEQESTNGRVPTYMLAGGLALIIPAVVLTLNATRFRPDESATEDRAPTNVPSADPGVPGGSSVINGSAPSPNAEPPAPNPTPVPTPAPAPPPQSLLDVHQGDLRLGLPVPQVRPMWGAVEQRQYGLAQGTEVRMPVLKVTF